MRRGFLLTFISYLGKDMRKKIAFITFIILLSFMPQMMAEEPAVFSMQAPDHELEVGEAFTITVFLEPGSKPIDGFIIHNLTWDEDCFDITSVDPGWWDWLFDGGKIGEDYVKWTQAGQKTKTGEKQVACVFNCIAEKGGNSDIVIELAQAISGGPDVSATWEPSTLIVKETTEPEDPPNPPSGGGGGGTYTPPPEEEPEEEPAQPQRETSMIMEGKFVFSSEPKEEQTADDTDEPMNTTTSSEQNETQEEDDEEPAIPLPEIMVAVGGVIGVAAIILYIVGKKRKRPRKKEPEDGEIVIGQ
jgi:hypothetical protein